MDSDYIAIAGGGTKGLMFVGMLCAIEDHIKAVTGGSYSAFTGAKKGFAGTSAGSLAALIMILDISPRHIRETMAYRLANLRSLAPRLDITMLLQSYGLDDGAEVRHMIESILELGGVSSTVTFSDLARLLKKEFVCVSTDVHTKRSVYFSVQNTPNLKIVDAVYMSCCLPFIWTPMCHLHHLCVDGSMTDNMPDCFPVEETFFIDFDDPQRTKSITNFTEYIQSIFLMAGQSSSWCRSHKHMLLRMPTHMSVSPIDFDINAVHTAALLNCGYSSMMQYIFKEMAPTIEGIIELMCTLVLDSRQRCVCEGL